MAPAALVAHLTAAGFGIRWAGDRLLVSPADQLTDELRALIREHRPALSDYLQQPPASAHRLWDSSPRRWAMGIAQPHPGRQPGGGRRLVSPGPEHRTRGTSR